MFNQNRKKQLFLKLENRLICTVYNLFKMGYKKTKHTCCIDCGKYKPFWYIRCYPCYMGSIESRGVIRSVFSVIWLPCIPTIVSKAILEALLDIGMPLYLLIGITLILAIYKYQEFRNILIQWKKGNWW